MLYSSSPVILISHVVEHTALACMRAIDKISPIGFSGGIEIFVCLRTWLSYTILAP